METTQALGRDFRFAETARRMKETGKQFGEFTNPFGKI
jgi:hypothetical protein